MSSYIQIEFQRISQEVSDLLIAELNEIGYEGFEEKENGLVAFITSINFDEKILNEVIAQNPVSFSKSVVEETNWNAVWESNFEPISVDNFVGLRADFHNPIKGVEHEIVITPKMSFGTGHHATTFMMIQQMREIDFSKKTVFDFGTGTGILAILAERLGAVSILAVDNDDWSIANAAENFERNHCIKVKLEKADSIMNSKHYDIILANINKNIILDNLSSLIETLTPTGTLLLSGLLIEDEADIVVAAAIFSLTMCKKTSKDNWICIRFNL
ncbi:MAG: 50S ribosomal protein L11 methyltransferase [Chitinophagaceae bacterium]